MNPCACGCGELVEGKWKRGHISRVDHPQKGKVRTPEHRRKLSESAKAFYANGGKHALAGKKLTPEHVAALHAGRDRRLAQDHPMRGRKHTIEARVKQSRAVRQAYREGRGPDHVFAGSDRKSVRVGLPKVQVEQIRNALLIQQGGKCAICGRSKPGGKNKVFHLDHCHATGKVRGLLCDTCNRGLGYFKDNPSLLVRAAKYLSAKPIADALFLGVYARDNYDELVTEG